MRPMQGMYSAVTRQVEAELIPCLRYHNIRFYAYSPLGGGILTGKYNFEQDEQKTIEIGRFNGIGWDKIYRERYWKKEHFDAINRLKELLAEHHPEEGVSVARGGLSMDLQSFAARRRERRRGDHRQLETAAIGDEHGVGRERTAGGPSGRVYG